MVYRHASALESKDRDTMAETATHKLKNKDVVALISNMLKLVIFDNTRDNAKRIFKDIFDGKTLNLPAIRMQDESEVPLRLKLDVTHFSGKPVFSQFRNHLRALLNKVVVTSQKGDIPMWVAPDGSQRMVNLPIPMQVDGHVNVLAMGFSSNAQGIVINLVFVDPSKVQRVASEDTLA